MGETYSSDTYTHYEANVLRHIWGCPRDRRDKQVVQKRRSGTGPDGREKLIHARASALNLGGRITANECNFSELVLGWEKNTNAALRNAEKEFQMG